MSCKIYRFTQQRQNVMILVHYLRKRCIGVLDPEARNPPASRLASDFWPFGSVIIMMLWQKVFCGD